MVPKGQSSRRTICATSLALRGSPAKRRHSGFISIFDVDVMRGMSFAVVPVKTTQPEKMVDVTQGGLASDKEGP